MIRASYDDVLSVAAILASLTYASVVIPAAVTAYADAQSARAAAPTVEVTEADTYLGTYVEELGTAVGRADVAYMYSIAPVTQALGAQIVYDGDTACREESSACVWSGDPTTIHAKSDAFAGWGGPGFDTNEDAYLLAHETAHVLQLHLWGEDVGAINARLASEGYDGFYYRDGSQLAPIEAQAECFAFAFQPDILGGYIDSCPSELVEHARIELTT